MERQSHRKNFLFDPVNGMKFYIRVEELIKLSRKSYATLYEIRNKPILINNKKLPYYFIDETIDNETLSKFLNEYEIVDEIWKEIPNDCSKSRLFVSDHGRLKRLWKRGNVKIQKPLIDLSKNGKECQLRWKINGKYVSCSRLVMSLFGEDIPKGKCVMHINNLFDNSISNLKIVDKAETLRHCGEIKARPILMIDPKTNEVVDVFENSKQVVEEYYIYGEDCINRVIVGRQKTCLGHKWEVDKETLKSKYLNRRILK